MSRGSRADGSNSSSRRTISAKSCSGWSSSCPRKRTKRAARFASASKRASAQPMRSLPAGAGDRQCHFKCAQVCARPSDRDHPRTARDTSGSDGGGSRHRHRPRCTGAHFQPLRTRRHRRHNPAGSGLGLYIAREIVTQHGGSIRAERRRGGGIALQHHRSAYEAGSPSNRLERRRFMCIESPNILLIEDDSDLADAIVEVLRMEGYRVDLCRPTAMAALGLLAEGELPDLILLDLMMPNMNGWEFREAQLRDPRLAKIPGGGAQRDRRTRAPHRCGTDSSQASDHREPAARGWGVCPAVSIQADQAVPFLDFSSSQSCSRC